MNLQYIEHRKYVAKCIMPTFFPANVVTDVRGSGELVKNKKGVEYVQIKTVKLKLKIGNEAVKFTNTDRNPQNDLIGKANTVRS